MWGAVRNLSLEQAQADCVWQLSRAYGLDRQEKGFAMAMQHLRSGYRALHVYLAGMIVVLVIIIGASLIWISTSDVGTDVLATDPGATGPLSAIQTN